jgi:hypothetical protein
MEHNIICVPVYQEEKKIDKEYKITVFIIKQIDEYIKIYNQKQMVK